MTRKLRAVIPAILCVALAASACSKKEETPTFTGDKTEEPSYQANLDFVTPAAYSNIQGLNLEPGTYISIIGKDESSSYWKEVKKGVEQAVEQIESTSMQEDPVLVVYLPDCHESLAALWLDV